MTVDKGCQAEHLRRLLVFFGRTPGVHLPVADKQIKLGSVLTIIGRPTGEPPRRNARSVEFDVKDARVSCARPSWQELGVSKFGAMLAQRHSMPPDIPFSYAFRRHGKDSSPAF